MTVLHVVGARPNFMKIAPLLRALEAREGFRNVLVHTGQHYDEKMSESFFRDLGIPTPDVNLGVGSGSHAVQTAGVMTAIEPVLERERPDLVMVVGDVNSTLAAALTAAKLGVPVAHLEAGLRSGDREMPEEINRILTDQLADLCLTPSRDADENLRREGVADARIHFVGNVMIDSLMASLPAARERDVPRRLGLERRGYVAVTLHRPSNVDDREQLSAIVAALEDVAAQAPVVLPLHPRTAARLGAFGLGLERVRVVEPLPYLEMLSLLDGAGVVLTDSGGIQEETTVLGVPCMTLRSSTERPVTITEGTNRLVPERSREAIVDAFRQVWGRSLDARAPEGWDGRTSERIADVLEAWRGGATGRRAAAAGAREG
ncbi:MAG: UDP-N-acetylglucosamine 2-epimerase (non-hydrolyzing) [Gemmatimonadetes bacterium]|nr:UDP-N-acetylglucosamine 2-epimerase (non-hydrolyzing) [Gemmatimonadota bacterium]